jgi:hypothetical protein
MRTSRSNRTHSGTTTPNTYLSQWSLSSPSLNQSEASAIPPGLAKTLLRCSTQYIGTAQMPRSVVPTTIPYTIIVYLGSNVIVDNDRNHNHHLHHRPGNKIPRRLHGCLHAGVSRGILEAPMNLIRRLEENLPHRGVSIKAKVLPPGRPRSVLLQRGHQVDSGPLQREHPYDWHMIL